MTKGQTSPETVKCTECHSEDVRQHAIRNNVIQYNCKECGKIFTLQPSKTGYRLNQGYCDKLLQYVIDTVPQRHKKVTLYEIGEVSKRTVDRYWDRSMLIFLFTLAKGLHDRYPGNFSRKVKNDIIHYCHKNFNQLKFSFQVSKSEAAEFAIRLTINIPNHKVQNHWSSSANIKVVEADHTVHIYYTKEELGTLIYLSPLMSIIKQEADPY